jgi:pimeloyl-ACP methyl ester carboxylesterase
VLVLPGLGTSDWSTRVLRRWLRRAGFDPRGWGLGLHRPRVDRTLHRLLPQLEHLAAERFEPIFLVGWSLGGLVARELARLRPDLVRGVVTLGTPVRGGFRLTALATFYRLQGYDPREAERLLEAVQRVPLRVPVLAILSRQDGIVAWEAAVDPWNPAVEHRLASSCHWGLGLDPEGIEAICDQLDRWCQDTSEARCPQPRMERGTRTRELEAGATHT